MNIQNLIPGGGARNPLAALEKDLARQMRDLETDTAKLAAAEAARNANRDAGADDTAQDQDEREVTLAARRVRRGEIARDALLARRAELTSAARAEMRRRLQAEMIAAGTAHGEAATRAATSARAYLAASDAMIRAGFGQDLAEFPTLITQVLSMENAGGASFLGDAPFPALSAFCWRIAAINDAGGVA